MNEISDCIERHEEKLADELLRLEFLGLVEKQYKVRLEAKPVRHVILDRHAPMPVITEPPTNAQWQEATRIAERLIEIAKKYDVCVWMDKHKTVDPAWITEESSPASRTAVKMAGDRFL